MTWQAYQEEAAEFFRSIGMEAETDATLQGVRTTHAIDVLVKSQHAGFEVTWLVECKKWNTRVSKLHVLALREIVADTGADRGILLSERGFQSGAIEAANLTNVQVTSLAESRVDSEHQISAMRLREIFDRNEACKVAYWDLPKADRIDHDLRPDVGEWGYSGTVVMSAVDEILAKSLRGRYPFELEGMPFYMLTDIARTMSSPMEAVRAADALVADLERRLKAAVEQA